MSRPLADLSWPEVRDCAAGALLVVPVGSTEQHGPHLPLSTDTDISIGLAELLSRCRASVIVAPPVAYGSSGEHSGFPGTLSIGQQATALLLVELGRSASDTFARMLIISAHGGNDKAVQRAAQRLRREGRDVLVFSPRWPGDAHAGRVETSLMLALHPDRLRLDRAAAGTVTPLEEVLPRLVSSGVRDVTANGVLGDPAGSSAEEGRRLLQDSLAQLCDLVDHWHERSSANSAF